MIAFVGSNSSKSINKQFTKALLKGVEEVEFVDIQDWNIPMYSEDCQKNDGFPELIVSLFEKISNSDKVIITVNEHNSNVSSFTKNILDWLSRYGKKMFADKDVLVLSASNGKRGGQSANDFMVGFAQRNDAKSVSGYPFASFSENFDVEKQEISNSELDKEFTTIISNFIKK